MSTQSDVEDRPVLPQPPAGVTVYRGLAYAENGHKRQTLDLYLPTTGENRPLIVWIHGGAFPRSRMSQQRPRPF